MLVYYEGNGLWFDFPSVDCTSRYKARKQWHKDNPLPTGTMDENIKGWEEYQSNEKKWEENNPPPKFTVREDEIILEKTSFFDLDEPILQFQPDQTSVMGLFKLKAKDEKQLRYKKEVIVTVLLPCKHPDSDNGGFFFKLDKPYTFYSEDVVLDEHSTIGRELPSKTTSQIDKERDNEKPWLIRSPKDPEPKYNWYTPARFFARQLVEDDSTLLTKRNILAMKIVTSLTSVGIKKRGGIAPFDPNTIKKALSNVKLG